MPLVILTGCHQCPYHHVTPGYYNRHECRYQPNRTPEGWLRLDEVATKKPSGMPDTFRFLYEGIPPQCALRTDPLTFRVTPDEGDEDEEKPEESDLETCKGCKKATPICCKTYVRPGDDGPYCRACCPNRDTHGGA